MHPDDHEPRREPIYRLIMAVMGVDVAVGIVLVVLGEFVLEEQALTIVGIGLAAIGAALLVFFSRLAARAAERDGRP